MFCPFLHPTHALTEARIQKIFHAARMTLVYRCEHVHAIDQYGQEHHICLREQLTTLDVAGFRAALTQALSFGLH